MTGLDLDQLCVNTLRFLSVDAVQRADLCRPGLPMGAAPMVYVLWTRLLRHNPSNPRWWDRDRVQWDPSSWPGDPPRQDGAIALSGAEDGLRSQR